MQNIRHLLEPGRNLLDWWFDLLEDAISILAALVEHDNRFDLEPERIDPDLG
ncbi:MAG: hypothetical protein V1767_08085 [Chloroflexota bacterium]